MKRLPAENKKWIPFFLGLSLGMILLLSYPYTLVQAPVIPPCDDENPHKETLRLLEIERINNIIWSGKKRLNHLKDIFIGNQPKKPYLIVNSAANKIRLLKAGRALHEGKCSTGSYILLKAAGQRQWLFKTPRGLYRVTVKLKDPWWYKPDWAYVEEDLPIPSKYSAKRYQPGVLGDYALGFGNGYLIHGTLYKRFLGMPVTHGCVRLDDDDMKLVFNTLTHSSRIYIY